MRITLIGTGRKCDEFMNEFTAFGVVHLNNDVDTFNVEYRQTWRI